MIITKWNQAQQKKNPHNVDVRLLYDKSDAQAMHIFLNPGEKLNPHITPVDVFFVVLEGEPSIQVGEEIKQTEYNALIESPKNIKHCIYNETDKPARILVVKTPKQSSASKIL